jgi:PAS domain S-box-containing protein
MGLLRVLIVSQEDSLKRAARALVTSHSQWSVCAEASDSGEALQKVTQLRPDVVLVDLSTASPASLAAFSKIRARAPHSEILIITEGDIASACEKVAQVSAQGYVPKSNLQSSLVPALESLSQQRTNDVETAQRLQVALRAAKLGTWELDLATNHLASSSQCKANFGRAPDDPFAYETFRNSIHPEDRERVAAAIQHSIDAVGEYAADYRCIWPDDSIHWVSATGTTLAGPDGRAARMMGVSQDVSDRKNTEEALREAKSRLETTLAASEVGTWTWDLATGRVDADPNLTHMFSFAPEKAVGRYFRDYLNTIHPEDRPQVETLVCGAIENPRGPYEADFRVVRQDGSVRWVTARAKIEVDATGRAIRFPGVLIDITARKQAEERERQLTSAAIATNAKFQAVFDQTSVFAGIIDLNGIVLEVNRLALDACGYTASQVIGHPFHQTPYWRASREVQSFIRQATIQAAHGSSIRETLNYSWADGTERIVDFVMYPIHDEHGRILFLHPTGVDITELKRTEANYRQLAESLDAEVRERTKELEERNAQIVKQSELLQHLSQRLMKVQDEERRRIARELHDSAGQLLSGLNMSLGAIARATKSSSPEIIEEVAEGRKIIEQLTQEIRTMSYLLHPPLLDEIGLAAALGWYIRGLSERSGLKISLDIPKDFARLPLELELVVFRLVQECLTNIHRHSGSATADISISSDAERLHLSVRDQGCGIAPHRLSTIQSQGSGVGIQGMRERVRQVHGELTVTSSRSGTTISVVLPIPEPNSAEEAALSATPGG